MHEHRTALDVLLETRMLTAAKQKYGLESDLGGDDLQKCRNDAPAQLRARCEHSIIPNLIDRGVVSSACDPI